MAFFLRSSTPFCRHRCILIAVESRRRGHSLDDCWLIQRVDDAVHATAERQVGQRDDLGCFASCRSRMEQVKKQREHQKVLKQIGREGRAVHEDSVSSRLTLNNCACLLSLLLDQYHIPIHFLCTAFSMPFLGFFTSCSRFPL